VYFHDIDYGYKKKILRQTMKFKAYLVDVAESGDVKATFTDRSIDDLPKGDVLINIHYSSLNYKDHLSSSGHRGITRNYPHTPGVDGAGRVLRSKDSRFKEGDEVLVTGHDLGMNTSGAYAQCIQVPSDWVVPMPEKLKMEEAMIYGTAGFTAGQCVEQLVQGGVRPEDGPILVTGATGGVGSVAVAILSGLGYEVMAATRDLSNKEFLLELGAAGLVDSATLIDDSSKPLLKSRWAGVVETVGGGLLETAIRSTQRRATVTFCGMIASPELNTSVYPFILRGLRLIGIDSAECPINLKKLLWEKLAGDWKPSTLSYLGKTLSWEHIPEELEKIGEGKTRGRVVFALPLLDVSNF
jgi:acrylyl-CoA reductase (NADPH)